MEHKFPGTPMSTGEFPILYRIVLVDVRIGQRKSDVTYNTAGISTDFVLHGGEHPHKNEEKLISASREVDELPTEPESICST